MVPNVWTAPVRQLLVDAHVQIPQLTASGTPPTAHEPPLVSRSSTITPSGEAIWQPSALMVPRTIRVTSSGGLYLCGAGQESDVVLRTADLRCVVAILPVALLSLAVQEEMHRGHVAPFSRHSLREVFATVQTPLARAVSFVELRAHQQLRDALSGAAGVESPVSFRLVFSRKADLTKFLRLLRSYSPSVNAAVETAIRREVASTRIVVAADGSGSVSAAGFDSVGVPDGPGAGFGVTTHFYRDEIQSCCESQASKPEAAKEHNTVPMVDAKGETLHAVESASSRPTSASSITRPDSGGPDEDDVPDPFSTESDDSDPFAPSNCQKDAVESCGSSSRSSSTPGLLNPLAVTLPPDCLLLPSDRLAIARRPVPFTVALQSTLPEYSTSVDIDDFMDAAEVLRLREARQDQATVRDCVGRVSMATAAVSTSCADTMRAFSPQRDRAAIEQFLFDESPIGSDSDHTGMASSAALTQRHTSSAPRHFSKSSSNVFPDVVCPQIYSLLVFDEEIL